MLEKWLTKNIRFIRKHKGLTLIELSSATNLSKSALSDYENGQSEPTMHAVEKIAAFFDINIHDLLYTQLDDINIRLVHNYAIRIDPKPELEYQLLEQKVDAMRTQVRLLENLIQSKEAEISSLKAQIILLSS